MARRTCHTCAGLCCSSSRHSSAPRASSCRRCPRIRCFRSTATTSSSPTQRSAAEDASFVSEKRTTARTTRTQTSDLTFGVSCMCFVLSSAPPNHQYLFTSSTFVCSSYDMAASPTLSALLSDSRPVGTHRPFGGVGRPLVVHALRYASQPPSTTSTHEKPAPTRACAALTASAPAPSAHTRQRPAFGRRARSAAATNAAESPVQGTLKEHFTGFVM
mmetsp:Transcript_25494/g.83941  ORF Transcript_25494/g.83941 Transcript_25494/m.83941 type:complete len:217 (-) Transcript_25494:180-830(-)